MNFAKSALLLAAAVVLLNAIQLRAQSLTVLHSFTNNPDGAAPWAGLLMSGNTLYGTTRDGGGYDAGTVFSVNADGQGFTMLHSFTNSPDGFRPYGGLVLDGATLYGTTAGGGDTNILPAGGTVFSLSTNGSGYSVLHTFSIADGQFPHGRLVLSGNTLFGTTLGAGSTGWGSVFSMNTDGTGFTVLHTFSSPTPANGTGTNPDGDQPWAGLVLSGSTLYGTAFTAGPNGFGAVYSLGTNGAGFNVLHAFSPAGDDPAFGLTNADGFSLQGGLLLSGNALYGTTRHGGNQGGGTVFSVNTDGTDFAVLHQFSTNTLDGYNPWAELLLSGSTLYGTTERGGSQKKGAVFSLGTNGTGFALLHSFTNNPEPAFPASGLVLSDNVLYGTTQQGGNRGFGAVFSVTISAPAPAIASFSRAGTSLVITATNGVAGRAYTLLTSTNLTSPLGQWVPVTTNVLNVGGSFTITATNALDPASPQGFYILQTSN